MEVVLILRTWSDLIVTRMYLVSIRDNTPCHVPLKYRCPIKKSDHIKPNILHVIHTKLWYPIDCQWGLD